MSAWGALGLCEVAWPSVVDTAFARLCATGARSIVARLRDPGPGLFARRPLCSAPKLATATPLVGFEPLSHQNRRRGPAALAMTHLLQNDDGGVRAAVACILLARRGAVCVCGPCRYMRIFGRDAGFRRGAT